MLTAQERNAIRMNLLFNVESGEKRSKIMRVAAAMSEGMEDEEDTYLSIIYHLSQPQNEKDLNEMFSKVASWLPDIEEGGAAAPRRSAASKRGKKVRRVRK